jgi:hypothetical protein
LVTIETKRTEDDTNNRRIIFIVHSHGGLVVKEALAIDSQEDDSSVSSHTDGIIFFGTPHRGSAFAGLAQTVQRAMSAWGSDGELIGSLVPGSKANWRLHDGFTKMLEKRHTGLDSMPIQIYNFYEERPTPIFNLGFGLRWADLVSEILPSLKYKADPSLGCRQELGNF